MSKGQSTADAASTEGHWNISGVVREWKLQDRSLEHTELDSSWLDNYYST